LEELSGTFKTMEQFYYSIRGTLIIQIGLRSLAGSAKKSRCPISMQMPTYSFEHFTRKWPGKNLRPKWSNLSSLRSSLMTPTALTTKAPFLNKSTPRQSLTLAPLTIHDQILSNVRIKFKKKPTVELLLVSKSGMIMVLRMRRQRTVGLRIGSFILLR